MYSPTQDAWLSTKKNSKAGENANTHTHSKKRVKASIGIRLAMTQAMELSTENFK